MNTKTIHRYLNEGATLNIKATGVIFESLNFPKTNRQELIKDMIEGVAEEDRELELVFEDDNKYDKYAIRIDYEGADVGYVPKNTDVRVITANERRTRIAYSKDINQILREFDGTLEAEVDAIYGGSYGKHYGYTINIKKSY